MVFMLYPHFSKIPAEYATQQVAKNYAFESAGWYWDVLKDINTKISQWASLSADATVTKVTQEINGGTNGLQARKDAYAKSKSFFYIVYQKKYTFYLQYSFFLFIFAANI